MAIKDRLLEAQAFSYIGNCLKATLQPEKAIECYKRVSTSSSYTDYNLLWPLANDPVWVPQGV